MANVSQSPQQPDAGDLGSYDYFRSAASLRAGVLMFQVGSPLIILFGTVGNVLSILILSKPRFSKFPSSVYLLALSVADLSLLYVGLLRQWVKYTFGKDIRYVSTGTCKVHLWLMYSNADVCVWILPAITIERLVSTLCPTKSKVICTKQRAKVVVAVILTSALAINSHILYGIGRLEIPTDEGMEVRPCGPLSDSYAHFFTKIWTWIDMIKYTILPFTIIVFGNMCIIFKVYQSSRKTRTQVGPSNSNKPVTTTDKMSSMSKLLVLLNFVFIVCVAPVCIYFIGEPYWIPESVPKRVRLQDPWWAVVNLLIYINSSVNFILYCVRGSRFKAELRRLFRCGRRDRTVHSTMRTTHMHSSLHI